MLKGKSIIGKKQQVEQGIKWGGWWAFGCLRDMRLLPGPVPDLWLLLCQDSPGKSVMVSYCVIWSSYLRVSSASEFLSGVVQPEGHPLAFIVVEATGNRCPWVLSTWERFHFALVFEGYFLQMENSELTDVYSCPSTLKMLFHCLLVSIDLWILAVWWWHAQA